MALKWPSHRKHAKRFGLTLDRVSLLRSLEASLLLNGAGGGMIGTSQKPSNMSIRVSFLSSLVLVPKTSCSYLFTSPYGNVMSLADLSTSQGDQKKSQTLPSGGWLASAVSS